MENAYTVKGIKTFRSTEGNGFNATLYLGKRRLGSVIDNSTGTPILFEISAEDKKALDEYVAGLPDAVAPFVDPMTGKPAVMKVSAELFVSRMVDKMLLLKKVKSFFKKGDLLVVIENKSVYKIEYTGIIKTKIIEDYRKSYPDGFVLNRLSDEEILAAFDTYGVV